MALSDVFWIENLDSIWRIKSLQLTPTPVGYFVDHLVRDEHQNLTLKSSYERLDLPQIHIETLSRANFFVPFDARSISELFKFKLSVLPFHVQNLPIINTQITYKLMTPLVPIIGVFMILTPCMCYTRHSRQFKIFNMAFFGFMFLASTHQCINDSSRG